MLLDPSIGEGLREDEGRVLPHTVEQGDETRDKDPAVAHVGIPKLVDPPGQDLDVPRVNSGGRSTP